MKTTNEGARLLQEWLTRGTLASQFETYINKKIRNGDSWYTSALKEKSRDEVEAELEEWVRRDRRNDFAAAVESVARGMLALALVDSKAKNRDEEYAKVVNVNDYTRYPRCASVRRPSPMVVVFNPLVPGCGCNAPEGSDDWARYGRLGLKALTLHAGENYSGSKDALLGLVFPQRGLSNKDMSEDGFTVATIGLDGHTNGHTQSPKGFTRDGYLEYSLGLAPWDTVMVNMQHSGGHFDDAIGFPGATDYLANALPKLGKYLTDVAAKLTDHEHKH